jgi:hypothetical protein
MNGPASAHARVPRGWPGSARHRPRGAGRRGSVEAAGAVAAHGRLLGRAPANALVLAQRHPAAGGAVGQPGHVVDVLVLTDAVVLRERHQFAPARTFVSAERPTCEAKPSPYGEGAAEQFGCHAR